MNWMRSMFAARMWSRRRNSTRCSRRSHSIRRAPPAVAQVPSSAPAPGPQPATDQYPSCPERRGPPNLLQPSFSSPPGYGAHARDLQASVLTIHTHRARIHCETPLPRKRSHLTAGVSEDFHLLQQLPVSRYRWQLRAAEPLGDATCHFIGTRLTHAKFLADEPLVVVMRGGYFTSRV